MRLDRRPNKHLTFGAGPHLCAGAGVARMEMAVTLETLIEAGVGLSLDPAAAPRWKTRGDRRGLSSLPLIIEEENDGLIMAPSPPPACASTALPPTRS